MERKQYNGEFKARVAIEAIKGEKTVNEIAGQYGVHSTQIAQWKKQVMEEIPRIFPMKKVQDARTEKRLPAHSAQAGAAGEQKNAISSNT